MAYRQPPLQSEVDVAADVAEEAAAVARHRQRRLRHLSIEQKTGPADLVSDVDRQLDQLIVDRLRQRFPEDGALSEEGGHVAGTSGRTWIVDPIDGTHNYLAGSPYYALTIALLDGTEPVLGVVYDACEQTVHSAVAGSAVRPDSVTAASFDVASALVAVNLPHPAVFTGDGLCAPLRQVGSIRINGSIALDLVWTALGRFDACLYRHRDNPWDWAAGELIARSHGKQVTTMRWGRFEVIAVGRDDVLDTLAAQAAAQG
jgi:myo-inositol-1(or 4)-monophosphatase